MSSVAASLLVKGSANTRYVEVVRESLGELAHELLLVSGSSHDPLCLRFRFGDRCEPIELRVLGSLSTKEETLGASSPVYVASLDGLVAAFPIFKHEITDRLHCLERVDRVPTSSIEHVADDATLKLMHRQAIACGMNRAENSLGAGHVLSELEWKTRMRSMSMDGMQRILSVSDSLDQRDASLTFSYHCGQEHSTKQFFDVSELMCRRFKPPLFVSSFVSGVKCLSTFGVSAFVGVAVDSDMQCYLPYWHPAGAPAAQFAPAMHAAVPLLDVGRCVLEPNGPTTSSPLVAQREELLRYLDADKTGLDTSQWINVGLFGRPAGVKLVQTLSYSGAVEQRTRELVVQGTRWNGNRNSLQQWALDPTSGRSVELFPSI